jgi:hypothetical protein
MAHPQARVTATRGVEVGGTEVLGEEQRQVLLAGREVLGVHRAEDRVERDPVVEGVDEPDERVRAAGEVGDGVAHRGRS